MQHAFQSKHSHSTPGISIYFHTPSCCDVARIHWPCSMYQLVQKVHLKGYSIQTVASKIHMKYCWIQSDCQPDPVPVAVNSKNLVIDSATCSDCIELYHLELHCISKKSLQQNQKSRISDWHRSERDTLIDAVVAASPCKKLSACTWKHQARASCRSPHSSTPCGTPSLHTKTHPLSSSWGKRQDLELATWA